MELCSLCCYAFQGPAKGSREDVNKVETISKFCEQISADSDRKCESLRFRSTSVCGDCLKALVSAVERREKAEEIEVQMRSLQVQVLRLMKELKQCMGGYLSEMRVIEEKIKCSEGIDSKVRKSDILESFQLRDGIITAVKELSAFQDQLSFKVNPKGDHASDSSPTAGPDKFEALDFQEEPESFDGPDVSSPDSYLEGQQEFDEIRDRTLQSEGNTTKRKFCKQDETLEKHKMIYEVDEDGPPAFQCHLCEKSYKREESLEAHLSLHQGQSYTCDQCGATFGDKYVYKKHLQTHDEAERKYSCDQCEKAFKTAAVLRRHVMRIHDNTGKNLKCPVCPKMFTNKQYLKQHSKEHK